MIAESRLAKATQVALILMISLVVLYFGRDFLIPLVLAIMTWSLIDALSDGLTRVPLGSFRMPRWLAMLVSMLLLLALLLLIYQILASQAEDLEAAAPVYQENFNRLVAGFFERFGLEAPSSTDKLFEGVNVGGLLTWLGGSVGSVLASMVLVLIYTGFLFAEQNVMSRKLDVLILDPEERDTARRVLTRIAQQVQSYVWMKTLVSAATGLLSYVVLKLLGIDFAAVWALLIFLLNFIPNIGSVLGVALPAMLTLVQFDTLTPFVIVVLCLGAVQFIVGNLLEPMLMGKSLNLSSFMIILSLTFWGLMWGIPGMFLSVPMMVMFATICANVKSLRGIAVLLSANGELGRN